MKNLVKCEVCGKEEKVPPSRLNSYKTCSHECSSKRRKSLTVNNCTCTKCGLSFHLKESQVKRYN